MARRFLAILAAGVLLVAPRAATRPNVLLITLDTTRADRMGFLGSARGLTPRLDALAKDSIVFTRAFAQAPVTTVSHATILTGQYPPAHGVADFGVPLRANVPYLPDLLHQQGYRTAAFVGSLILDPRNGTAPGFDRGFDVYDAGFRLRRPGENRYDTIERRGDEVVARAVRWLAGSGGGARAASGGEPFFLWVHLYDPHDPYDPPADLKLKYASAPYDGEIASVDRAVGRLVDALAARRLLASTAIVVSGDHGEALGEHGESTHGVFLYDETLHVPLLLRLPGVAAGRVTTRVRLADVAPTILDAIGVAPPAAMQGESMLGLAGLKTGATTDERGTTGATSDERGKAGGAAAMLGLAGLKTGATTDERGNTGATSDGRGTTGATSDGRGKSGATRDERGTAGATTDERGKAGGVAAMHRNAGAPPGKGAADRPVYAETEYPRRAFGWSPLVSWRADRFLYVRAPRRELYDIVADPAERQNIASSRPRVVDGIDTELEQFVRKIAGAPEPAGGRAVDPAVAERLAALGYVSGSGGTPATTGVDPKDRIATANALHDAVVLVEDGKFQKAVPLLERVVSTDPNIYMAQLQLGVARARQHQYARAVAPLNKAIALQPDVMLPHYELGVALYETGDLKRAAGEFELVAAKMPKWADARYSLASVDARIDRVDEAVKELHAALALEPRHYRANLLLGRILTLEGKPAEAVPYLQTAVEVQPGSTEARSFLAEAMQKAKG